MKEQIEKQAIEEMARIMLEKSNSANAEPIFTAEDGTEIVLDEKSTKILDVILEQAFIPFLAEALYTAGYRKQSEWISVDERLPQVTGKYICVVKDKGGNAWTVPADWSLEMKMWFGEFGEIKNMVNHWMPLPEPPKMKGE